MDVVIWKHVITKYDEIVELPECSEFLCMQLQYERPTIWFRVQDTTRLARYRIYTEVTGGDANCTLGMSYLGTYQQDGFIGHVFVRRV